MTSAWVSLIMIFATPFLKVTGAVVADEVAEVLSCSSSIATVMVRSLSVVITCPESSTNWMTTSVEPTGATVEITSIVASLTVIAELSALS